MKATLQASLVAVTARNACMLQVLPVASAIVNSESAIQRACSIAGGQSALARKLTAITGEPISPQSVQQWCRSGIVPPRRVLAVELAVDAKVSRHELDSELYPQKDVAASEVSPSA
jgi:DNA-binding transcriptional regulator YdaS (Cro superfamily)